MWQNVEKLKGYKTWAGRVESNQTDFWPQLRLTQKHLARWHSRVRQPPLSPPSLPLIPHCWRETPSKFSIRFILQQGSCSKLGREPHMTEGGLAGREAPSHVLFRTNQTVLGELTRGQSTLFTCKGFTKNNQIMRCWATNVHLL